MRIISEDEFRSEVKPILDSVFASSNEWGEVFTTNIDRQKILYPLDDSDDLNVELLEAIIVAAIQAGDKGCYLSEIWRHHKHND
ncbi:hypothetical protein [Vasconcelosia minhoensis]|uniref:hypothetical protein n=1 Tax=Vasconcelosia minhoensis TaxID=3366354 RepID=UPI00187EC7C4|nr:hypothetical protein [Romeria gracilis]